MTAVNDSTSIVELTHCSGARAELNLFGATLTSFYTANEPSRNVLFVSKDAKLDGTKPIRGGIPLVFPIFGSAEGFPNHGFARTAKDWNVSNIITSETNTEEPTKAELLLQSSTETMAIWPFTFNLIYQIDLYPEKLVTRLIVENKETEKKISFHLLLHTYFQIKEAANGQVMVHGLKGATNIIDKVQGITLGTFENETIQIDGETDSIFVNAPDTIIVRAKEDPVSNTLMERIITITKSGSISTSNNETRQEKTDAVVWNPWIDKAKGMSDFGNEEYHEMICVEPGKVSSFQELLPREVYTLAQEICVELCPTSQL